MHHMFLKIEQCLPTIEDSYLNRELGVSYWENENGDCKYFKPKKKPKWKFWIKGEQ